MNYDYLIISNICNSPYLYLPADVGEMYLLYKVSLWAQTNWEKSNIQDNIKYLLRTINLISIPPKCINIIKLYYYYYCYYMYIVLDSNIRAMEVKNIITPGIIQQIMNIQNPGISLIHRHYISPSCYGEIALFIYKLQSGMTQYAVDFTDVSYNNDIIVEIYNRVGSINCLQYVKSIKYRSIINIYIYI